MEWVRSNSLIPVYTIHQLIVTMCTKFQLCTPHSSSGKVWQKMFDWELERKKNEKIKGQISSNSLILVYTIHPPTVHVCTKFQPSRPTVPEKSVTKIFNVWKLERKKNEEIKGWISSSSLILVYMIHPPIVQVCPKFQLCRHHSSWENCDKNFHLKVLQNHRMTDSQGNSSIAPTFFKARL